MGAARGRFGAGHGDQVGLGLTVERPPVLAGGPLPLHGGREPVGDEAPPHPLDRGDAHVERASDLLVVPRRAASPLVGLEDDPSMGQFSRRAVACGDALAEVVALGL